MLTGFAWRHVPGLLLALSTLLTFGNWYLRPERAMAWSLSAAMLGVMSIALLLDSPRWSPDAVRRYACAAIRSSVGIAALIMFVSLAVKFGEALGVLTDPDLSRRASQIGAGVFLMFMGNLLPKTLTPLSRMSCNPASVQAFQRFAGWTWVLTGLGFTMAWLVLPVTVAKPVSLALILTGILLVVARMARWRWA